MNLKLKRTPGLYLAGFMASGKTTAGRVLAAELGWRFADIDSEIEQGEGMSISQIFRERGESAFRDLETAIIRRYVRQVQFGNPLVIALGGGALIQPANWQILENNGITIWLDCPLERIRKRLGNDTTRPLAADPQRLAQLFEERRPLYSRAHFRVEADCDDAGEIVGKIMQLPIF
ncbi:MAG: shikimate kinase [Acidobacteriaceae bacterium]|nr:shikimate kinase [Acidobacteriaceae bacterium]